MIILFHKWAIGAEGSFMTTEIVYERGKVEEIKSTVGPVSVGITTDGSLTLGVNIGSAEGHLAGGLDINRLTPYVGSGGSYTDKNKTSTGSDTKINIGVLTAAALVIAGEATPA